MLELDEAVEMVRGILASNPKYVAPNAESCRYFKDNGQPDCVVGHVFSRIGIRKADLLATYAIGNSPNGARVTMIDNLWSGKVTDKAAIFLQRVQDEQDRATPWGEILPHLDKLKNEAA